MRGRDYYKTVRPMLFLGICFLKLLPRSIVKTMYLFARPLPTVLGIAIRYMIVARLALRCGECVSIHENVYLQNIDQLELGDHVSIHPMCYLDSCGGLEIGSNVSIAHASTVMTTEHSYGDASLAIRDAPVKFASVSIGSNVWIGCGVRILAGTNIGDGSVVGAGAVVTKDVLSATVSAGVPARQIKKILPKAA